MTRCNYLLRYIDEHGKVQSHRTDVPRLEMAIAETQNLPDYVRLHTWVSYCNGESGYFDPVAAIPAVSRA